MKASAFGVQPQVEHVKMPLRFAGQYSDDEVGLFYNYFRFYNPETGRYIENDPIDLQGGLNRYGYVGGSPLHYVDPKGLVEWQAYYGEFGIGLNILGGKVIHFVFKSKECVNNRKAIVNVIARGIGLSAGVDPLISLGVGTADFSDNNSHIDPYVFNGKFIYGGLSWGFSGSKVAPVIIGESIGNMNTKWGKGLHTDLISVEVVGGYASVIGSPKWEVCNCEN